MKKIGYINCVYSEDYIEQQYDILKKKNLHNIVFENKLNKNSDKLNAIIENLHRGDQLVVFELKCLGKSLIQLGDFLKELKKKEIELIVIKKNISQNDVSDNLYRELLISLSCTEREILKERTSRGLEQARRNGRVGGRPKISEEVADRIKFMYYNEGYTLREIAEKCNVSLGSAYKYTQNNQKNIRL